MTARILSPSHENVAIAAEALLRGDVVGIPTETVYGLAGLALDETALAKIFSTKDRPTFDPLIVHVSAELEPISPKPFDWCEYLARLDLVDSDKLGVTGEQILRELTSLWPGPLTVVVPKKPLVPDLATAGLPTVAIRAPRHPVAQALLRAVGQPLAAPSANRFGRISPTCAEDVAAELGDRLELILDGGPCEVGLESTVVQIDDENVVLLRPGAVSRELLEQRLRRTIAGASPISALSPSIPHASPGMLISHYAPRKPFFLLPAPLDKMLSDDQTGICNLLAKYQAPGILVFSEKTARQAGWTMPGGIATKPVVLALSVGGELAEAAHNLFRLLRELDAHPAVDVILAEPIPTEEGLGYALADRLRRASRLITGENASSS